LIDADFSRERAERPVAPSVPLFVAQREIRQALVIRRKAATVARTNE
jgi:hypothetical protein